MEVDVIFLDFSKAFDSVKHHILLNKLAKLGIQQPLMKWISSYLEQRTVAVRVSGITSSHAPINCGVPQGSVLGPILFLIYVNDLPGLLESPCQLFADDAKLWRAIADPLDQEALQADVNKVADWAKVNQLPLNINKCKVLSLRGQPRRRYKLGSQMIPTSTLEKDLGIFIQPNLHNSSQAAQAASAANRHLGLIRRTFGPLDKDIAKTLITLYIRPPTEYAIQVWSPWLMKDRRSLERPQRRATKLVKGIRHLAYSDRLRHLNLYSVAYRRIRGDLILAFSILKNPAHPCAAILPLSENPNLRGHPYKLKFQHSKLDCRRFFFSLRICQIWNSLPTEVVESTNIATFKQRLDTHLSALHFTHD